MDWINYVISAMTLIASGGWFVTYRAYKRKQDGEATQAEADGWEKMQNVYQQTIDDLNNVCDKIRKDRDMLMEENIVLREENRKLHEKYNNIENQVIDLRRDMARMGRKLEVMLPFSCAVAGCTNRKKVEIQEDNTDNEN